jgi:diketogulonate reductase-like aldo/keto reductase
MTTLDTAPALRRFGRTAVDVPVIGQGTWQMERDARASCIEALRAGLDLGMTHLDTAELYGEGRVETLVGEAIAGRRDDLFLVSKVKPNNAGRFGAIEACERSLKRLGTDRLDCYLLHWRGPVPLAETIEAFERLEQAGKIRSWGVSNFDVADLEEAERLAGPGRIACNQVLYHPDERAIEEAVIPWCETRGIAVVGYSPFGSRGGFPTPDSARGRALDSVAAKHGVNARQVVLAWVSRTPALLAIPKASRPEHVRDNARALRLTLDADDLATLERAFPPR